MARVLRRDVLRAARWASAAARCDSCRPQLWEIAAAMLLAPTGAADGRAWYGARALQREARVHGRVAGPQSALAPCTRLHARTSGWAPAAMGLGGVWMPRGGRGAEAPAGSGKGRRASRRGGAGGFTARRESEDDAKRVHQLTAEARNPSAHLTIVETSTAVTITDDRGQSRPFHPNGKEEKLQIEGVSVGGTTKTETGRLA